MSAKPTAAEQPAEAAKPDNEYLLGWVSGIGQCGELWKADNRTHQDGCPATLANCVPDDCACGLSELREQAILKLQSDPVAEQPAPAAEGFHQNIMLGDWRCACGWQGLPNQMTANASGGYTCPQCGASGGLIRASEGKGKAALNSFTWEYLDGRRIALSNGPTDALVASCDSESCWLDISDEHAQIIEDAFNHRPSIDSQSLAKRVIAMCKHRDWSLHWTARGAYLHLESSELIEAVRGKRGEVLEEAGDVLLVLMSITENEGIEWSDVEAQASYKCDSLMTKPIYPGEQRGLDGTGVSGSVEEEK